MPRRNSERRGRPRSRNHRQAAGREALRGLQTLEPRMAFAVGPTLVADINTLPASSLGGTIRGSDGPTTPQFVTFTLPASSNEVTIYPADDGVHGRELWVSDGTPSGTRMLKDINPTTTGSEGRVGDSDPADFFIAGDTLYFSANDGVHGRELWVSDGTSAGTRMVKDINATPTMFFRVGSSNPRDFTTLPGGEVLFVTGESGLWKTDGTEAGTVPIDPENTLGFSGFGASSLVRGLTRVGTQVVFTGPAQDTTSGFTTELWTTDGTLANTVPLRWGENSPVERPRDFTVVTETRTTKDSSTGSPLSTTTTELAFFFAQGGLWRTDGTPAGTVNVSSLVNDNFGAPVVFGQFTDVSPLLDVSGSRLVFSGGDGTTGQELWTIDGSSSTTAVPTQIANINQTTVSGFENGSFPTDFRVAGPNLFFTADDGINGRELWKYDGTTAAMVRDIRPELTPPSASEIFSTTKTFTASAFVQGAAVADFNGDGKPDMVLDLDSATVGADETLGILLGVGDGSFTEVASLTYGPQTAGSALNLSGLATGDVNNDGHADIVISRDRLQSLTSVFLGNGDGTFGPEQVFSDTGFTDLTIADIDRDGKLDLVTFTGSPALMRGNGDGTFQTPASVRDFINSSEFYQTDGGTVGDVDGDGDLDVVTLDLTNRRAVVFLNRGDGTFEPERFLPLGADPGSVAVAVAVADVNADGRADIVTGNFDSLSILLGTGGGLFAAPQAIALPGAHTNIAIVDVDGDSRLDIVTSTTDTDVVSGAAGVNVLRGRGDGTFAAATRTGPTNGSLFLAVSDFDGSGRPDVAVHAGQEVSVLLNSGSNGSPAGSEPALLAASGSTLFFFADDGVHGRELWKSDGTAAGTMLVKDIRSGANSIFTESSASFLSAAVLGGELLFAADDGQRGVELWKSDATDAGTVLVKDINPETADGFDSGSGAAISAALFDGAVYFPANDGIHGTELWKSDGTPGGTRLVRDLNPDAATFSFGEPQFAVAGNLLFFTWPRETVDSFGYRYPVNDLWRTDGTEAGTILLKQDTGYAQSLSALGTKVVFAANDPSAGRELWISDGTVAGTSLLADIQSGGGSGNPSSFFAFGDLVLFAADDGVHGSELWKTDGTPEGTQFVVDINTFDPLAGTGSPGLTASGLFSPEFTLFAGQVYFVASDAMRGVELWRTDGTAAGTTVVTDLNPDSPTPSDQAGPGGGSSSPYALTPFGTQLLFGNNDTNGNGGLWKTDGTLAGTSRISTVSPYPSNVQPFRFTVAGGKAFFGAYDGTGYRLWQTDGTTAGTAVVPDVDPTYDIADIGSVVAFGSEVFFSADRRFIDPTQPAQRGLFRSDGTVAGTSLVELSPGVFGSRHFPFIAAADRLYFAADDDVHGLELWQLSSVTVPPTATALSDRPSLRGGQTATVTFTLSEASADFAANAVTVTGGTLENFTGSGAAYTATFVPQANFSGTATIQIAAGTFTDTLGTPNTASAVTSITVDTIPPTVTILSSQPSLGIGQTATVTFTLSELPASFAAGMATVTGGTLENFAGSGTSYTATFVPQPNFNGTATIDFAPGAFTDVLGNNNVASNVTSITVDTISPTVTVLSDRPSLRGGQTATVTFTLSSSATNFIASDVAVTGGTLTSFSGAGTSYTATFVPQPNFSGAATIQVAAGAFTDTLGNPNTASAVTSITVDTIAPTVTILSDRPSLRGGQTAAVTFTLSETPAGFAAGAVSVTGGSLTNFSGAGTSYTATFVPQPNFSGTATIQVAAGAFTDTLGNPNTASAVTSITVDTIAPTVTILSDRQSLRGGQTAAVTFTLSEAPAGFAAGAVTVSGGTLESFTGSGTSYTATFVPQPNFSGTATIQVAAGAFTDVLGNPNTASAVTSITVDTIAPTVTILSDRQSLRGGQTAAVTFTLSEPPAGFAAGAVTVSGGTLENFTGSGTSYTATFVPQASFSGTATIQVAAGAFTDVLGNPNTASAVTSITVDTVPPSVLITLGAQSLGTGETAAVTFTLSEASADFAAGAVTVTGGTLENFTGSGTSYTATFVPQPNFVGTATIQVAAGVFTDVGGNANSGIPPLPIAVDTRPRGAFAVGTDGNPLAASREFAYTASGPKTIRISGLSATQSGFFSPRMRLTITPTDALATVTASVLRRTYEARSRTVTLTLDREIPVSPAAGTLVLGVANAPGGRLIDANTGRVNREIGGADLVAAGYSTVFVTRFQGGLRVAAGDVDGDAAPDLAAAPGATPARSTTDFGLSARLVSLFNGGSTAGWSSTSVDVSSVFPGSAGEGLFVALGDVVADGAGSGVRELIVASGRRIAVFEVLVTAGIPSIVETPLQVVDLEAPGRITAVATGPLFAAGGFDDIVVASTTGTQRVPGSTTVTVLGGSTLQALRSFGISSFVESGPSRRLVDIFGRGASVAVGDVDGNGQRDIVLGAGANGLGNFRVLANEFVTAATATTNREAFIAAIDSQLGNTSRFGHRRPAGGKWKPTGGPDFFTPGDVVGPTGSGFNAPLAVATVSGDAATGGKAWVFAALGATNQTGNEVRRLLYAAPGTWTKDATFSQLPAAQGGDAGGRFRPGTGLRLG